jgi:hypothetical protein
MLRIPGLDQRQPSASARRSRAKQIKNAASVVYFPTDDKKPTQNHSAS